PAASDPFWGRSRSGRRFRMRVTTHCRGRPRPGCSYRTRLEGTQMTGTHSHPTGSTAGAADARRIRVLVVDDHPAVRHGVVRLIEQQPDMVVTASVASVDD